MLLKCKVCQSEERNSLHNDSIPYVLVPFCNKCRPKKPTLRPGHKTIRMGMRHTIVVKLRG